MSIIPMFSSESSHGRIWATTQSRSSSPATSTNPGSLTPPPTLPESHPISDLTARFAVPSSDHLWRHMEGALHMGTRHAQRSQELPAVLSQGPESA
ncbi:hypothetical protein K456DRAFT_47687, partial [Colletotrichum gloeosporioides 23]